MWQYNSMMKDVIIIGAGPAGLTASIYARRAGLEVLVIEKNFPGGQMALTPDIANFPGFLSVSGFDLAMNMQKQAEELGVHFMYDAINEIESIGFDKKVHTLSNGTIAAKTIIIATGASPKPLGLGNESEFIGKGISYCATCDGNFYKDKVVCVVGGGNTAIEDAIYLTKFAKKVYLIHRRDEFRGARIMSQQLNNFGVELVLNSTVSEIIGDDRINAVKISNVLTGDVHMIETDGLFVAIGSSPSSQMFQKQLKCDDYGYIITDENCLTNVPGVWAVGDVRQKFLRQVVTACSDGAIASERANLYITENKSKFSDKS